VVTRTLGQKPRMHVLSRAQMQRAYSFETTQWVALPRGANHYARPLNSFGRTPRIVCKKGRQVI
jgi:hypothetical protein